MHQVPASAVPHRGGQKGLAIRERLGVVFGTIAAVIWGGYLAACRHAIGEGLGAPDLAFLRYVTAGIVLAPWLLRHSVSTLAGIGWSRGLLLALLAGPPFVLAGASGYHFAPLAHGAVIQLGVLTMMGVLLGWGIVGEHPGVRRLVGLAIVVLGLAVTAGPSVLTGSSTAWIGDLLFALAGSMWALFTVLQRRWVVAPLAATAVVSVLSGAIYGPAYLLEYGWSALASARPAMLAEQVLVQGLLSGVVALFAFSRAVQLLGPGRAAFFPALAPGVAILLGVPLSGDLPTLLQLIGLAILSAGLLVAASGSSPAAAAPSKE